MEGSQPLHNFNLPQGLTWGRQNLLRCMNPVRPSPAFDDDESSNSIEKSHSEVEGFEGEDNSSPSNPKSNKKFACKASPPPPPPPPPPPIKICSEGGGDGGINADAETDLGSEKKSTRPRRNRDKKNVRPKFSIALSRKEIEEDFIAMTGKKPPRKPNKFSKNIQIKLDAATPGSWLSEIHPDRYKVDENGKV